MRKDLFEFGPGTHAITAMSVVLAWDTTVAHGVSSEALKYTIPGPVLEYLCTSSGPIVRDTPSNKKFVVKEETRVSGHCEARSDVTVSAAATAVSSDG